MASIDDVLSRLHGVKKAGNGWAALCPAHEEKNPSLTLTEDNGKILMHCFAGCAPLAVLDALGLKFEDLFPESYESPPKKRVITPALALEMLQFEALFLRVVCHDIERGRPLDAQTIARVKVAQERIDDAIRLTK